MRSGKQANFYPIIIYLQRNLQL